MNAHLIRSKGNTALVESADGGERRIVPAVAVVTSGNGLVYVHDDDWQRGIEQSFNWEHITELCIPVATVEKELRKRGLYCAADIKANFAVARAALNDAAGETIARLLNGGI